MACLAADGTLTREARALLALLTEPLEPAAIAARLGTPLFRVRASLREMSQAGLVESVDGGYLATAQGRERAAG